jgi:subtilisin
LSTFMKKIISCAALIMAVFTVRAQQPGETIPDHYIVQLDPGADPAAAAARHGVGPTFLYRTAVRGYAAMIPPGLLKRVQADPRVLSIVPDRVMSIVAKGGKPPSNPPPPAAEEIPAGVSRVQALGNGYSGAGVGIAIVDTGVDLAHPDLALGEESFSAYGGTGQDDNGHGTHVAGIAAALGGNGIGVVGVAPDATIYAVKVLDQSGSGWDSEIIAGLEWIAETPLSPPIRVVNMSLGRTGTLDDNPLLRGAISTLTDLGISVIVAAGNNPLLQVSDQVPACYPEVLPIASSTALNGSGSKRFAGIPADTASYFTSDGAAVTVSAPGETQENVSNGGLISSVGILSTTLGGGTTRMSGTSMASPHAAGVAALLYEQANMSINPSQVRAKLSAGAERQGIAPFGSPTGAYSYDGLREGILSAPGALSVP